jgi:hypothetical protein
MRNNVLKLYTKMRNLKDAMVGALAATVSMKALATTIGTAFTSVGTKLTTYTS